MSEASFNGWGRAATERATKSLRERRSLIDQEDNKRLCLQGVHTGTYGTNHSTNISKISRPFHHRVYYQLTIACFPVGLISTMDRVRFLVDRKSQGSIPGQAWKFSGSFSTLRLFILLQRSHSLSYLYPHFKMWLISSNIRHLLSELLSGVQIFLLAVTPTLNSRSGSSI